MRFVVAAVVVSPLWAACTSRQEPKPRPHSPADPVATPTPAPEPVERPAAAPPATPKFGELSRTDFNRIAVQQNLPVYWTVDANNNHVLDPGEVASLLFYPTSGTNAATWVANGAFTPAFEKAYAAIAAAFYAPAPDDKRRQLVRLDLEQGRPTLVANDFHALSAGDRAFVTKMLEVAAQIDTLYATQNGTLALAKEVPADPESQSAFRRNRGPKCVGPKTENDAACTAIPGGPVPIVSVYPDAVAGVKQGDPGFCKALEKAADAKLLSPFTVVREAKGKLTSAPFTDAYKEPMANIAKTLADAAAAMKDPAEGPLVAYLQAAAKSFTTNNWDPADEAWAKMTVDNSKWYVRVGPDETYWEPCAHKGGFHLTFARINQGSKAYQQAFVPVQQDMEAAVASHAGAPYKARKVTFHLPDFIDIIVNAGDDRTPTGATIGQSLPNWGPVVAAGRGRTVAMVNLYLDPDSLAARRGQAESLLDAPSMQGYTGKPEAGLLGTVLHEVTHNLGPAHEYKVGGKADGAVFGGPIASMLEELKAQTGALFLLEFLKGKHVVVDDKLALESYTDAIVWAFGHISQGMYAGDKSRKAYGNLAAIQIGFLIEKGALTWDDNAFAGNKKDKGTFTVHADKLPGAVDELMKLVAGIKARGDVKLATELVAKYVDSDKIVPHGKIAERFLRFPKASFVYAVSL